MATLRSITAACAALVAVTFVLAACSSTPAVSTTATATTPRATPSLGFTPGTKANPRVVVITAGLVLAPWGVLPWSLVLLAATAWITVVQRVLHVRTQLMEASSE